MKAHLALAVLLAALASPSLLAGCKTADRGTSTVTSGGEQTEPQQDAEPQTMPDEAPVEPAPVEPTDTSSLERDVARPGSDYREVAMQTADPVLCKQYCDKQMRCMAFTYLHPDDTHGPRCRLKHSIPEKVEGEECCVSGVNPRAARRIAQLEAQGFELDTDRPGRDFRSFEMQRAEPARCKEACDNLKDCRAFTYVRPGHEGEKAYCHLKNDAPDPVTDKDCCISGLKPTR